MVHYIPNKNFLILRMNFTKKQERRPFKRNKQKMRFMDTSNKFKAIKQNAFKIRFDSLLMKMYSKHETISKIYKKKTEIKQIASSQDLLKKYSNKNSIFYSFHSFRELNSEDSSQDLISQKPMGGFVQKSEEKINKLWEENRSENIPFKSSNNLQTEFLPKKKMKNSKESKHNLQNLIFPHRRLSDHENDHLNSDENILISNKITVEEKKNEIYSRSSMKLKTKIEDEEMHSNANFNEINPEEKINKLCQKNELEKGNEKMELPFINNNGFLKNKESTLKKIHLPDLNTIDKGKNTNMFMYDFETLKNFSNYFKEGNSKNIVKIIMKSRKSVYQLKTRKSVFKHGNVASKRYQNENKKQIL